MMTMVAKTGLLTDVSASHIDEHPFHQVVLSHGHDNLLGFETLHDLHEFSVFPADPNLAFLCPVPFSDKELRCGIIVKKRGDRDNHGAPGGPRVKRHAGKESRLETPI